MATVRRDDRGVAVELAWWERLFGGGRERLLVPLSSIASVDRVDRPTKWSATPGGRSGMVVTGVLKVGRWGLGTKTRRFVSVRRWRPALRIVLTADGADQLGYAELLISTPSADTLVASLRNTNAPR